jgi:hypothetical protein
MWLNQYKKRSSDADGDRPHHRRGLLRDVRGWGPTLSFFLVLQGAALAGALWASRIKRRLDPHAR